MAEQHRPSLSDGNVYVAPCGPIPSEWIIDDVAASNALTIGDRPDLDHRAAGERWSTDDLDA